MLNILTVSKLNVTRPVLPLKRGGVQCFCKEMHFLYCIDCLFLQEMLDIMKSIYDMMGKYTYPTMQDDAPRDHVETFFQVEKNSSLNFHTSNRFCNRNI